MRHLTREGPGLDSLVYRVRVRSCDVPAARIRDARLCLRLLALAIFTGSSMNRWFLDPSFSDESSQEAEVHVANLHVEHISASWIFRIQLQHQLPNPAAVGLHVWEIVVLGIMPAWLSAPRFFAAARACK